MLLQELWAISRQVQTSFCSVLFRLYTLWGWWLKCNLKEEILVLRLNTSNGSKFAKNGFCFLSSMSMMCGSLFSMWLGASDFYFNNTISSPDIHTIRKPSTMLPNKTDSTHGACYLLAGGPWTNSWPLCASVCFLTCPGGWSSPYLIRLLWGINEVT